EQGVEICSLDNAVRLRQQAGAGPSCGGVSARFARPWFSSARGSRAFSFGAFCWVDRSFSWSDPWMVGADYTPGAGLLHGNRLGEVPGLINFAPLEAGDMIGEQLHRQNRQRRSDRGRINVRNSDHEVGFVSRLLIAVEYDRRDGA